MITAAPPFLAFRFAVSIDGLEVGGFSEVSGLDLTMTIQDYAEGGLNDFVRKFPGPVTQANIVLKRGVADRSLWDWFAELRRGVITYRSGSITVMDPTGQNPLMRVDFLNAVPAKWSGPALDAGQGKVAVESLELAHQGLEWQG